jgi:hypothetical protein
MNPRGDGKPEPSDPDQLLRLIDIELAQKRAARARSRSPFRAFRLASFIFLFAVILGVALAFYYVFYSGGLDDVLTKARSQPSASPSASAP